MQYDDSGEKNVRAGVAVLLCGAAVESTARIYIRLKNRRDDNHRQELVAFPAASVLTSDEKRKREEKGTEGGNGKGKETKKSKRKQ